MATAACVTGRAGAAGVTLITHGFNSDVASWVVPMQGRVAQYGGLSPSNTACYEITLTENGSGQYMAAATFLSGTNPLVAASGEILIKLNWSTLSGLGGPSTLVIADAAARALTATNLIPALGGHALAELPLHLVGHSRGASVVAETARLLGADGIWVEHLTGLDPVPVASFGDPDMKLYENVLYADNYWQNLGVFLDPQGQSLAGAYNRRLLNLGGAAYSAHSDVHLWYHGTIDPRTPVTVDGATITATERQNWWQLPEQRGTNAGFRLSRIGGGDWLSNAEPAGPGNGRISDGFNRNYDLGAGRTTNRFTLPAKRGVWPSALLLTHTATNPIPAGESFTVTLQHQSGTNQATNVELRVFLDRDGNPWNGNETLIHEELIAGTGTNATAAVTRHIRPDPARIVPGTWRMQVRLNCNGKSRWLQSPAPVVLTTSIAPPLLAVRGWTNGAFALHVGGYLGQNVVTEASTNLLDWAPVSTNSIAGTGFDLLDASVAGRPFRFYRSRLQP